MLTPKITKVLVGVGLNAFGNGLTLALLLVYLVQIREFSVDRASILLSWMAVLGLLLTGVVGAIVDRIGPRPVLLAGLVIEAIGVGFWSQVHTFRDALLVSSIVALGGSSIWPPQSALLAQLAPVEHRQRVFGLNFMLLNAGLGLGGLVSALLIIEGDTSSFERLYYLNSISYVAYFVIAISLKGVGGRVEHDPEVEQQSGGYKEVFADRRLVRLAVGGLLMLICGYASVEAGLAIFTTEFVGLSPKWLGVIFGVNTFTIVSLQAFILKWMDHKSRTRLLGLVGVMWACSWIVIALTVQTSGVFAVFLLCASQFVFAIGEMLWAPISPAMANELAPDHLRGRYNAMISLQWGVANTIGPLITGLTLGRGHPFAWTLSLAAGCLIAGYLMVTLKRYLTAEQDGRKVTAA